MPKPEKQTLEITWEIHHRADGWWVHETIGMWSNRFGPIPHRQMVDGLILERRAFIQKVAQAQIDSAVKRRGDKDDLPFGAK